MTAESSNRQHSEAEHSAAECVGSLEMRLGVSAPTPKSTDRWASRAQALVLWLLGEWRRQERGGEEE